MSVDDLWVMIVSTIRYSLGRATYMPGWACEIYQRYKIHLTPDRRKQIYDEVRGEIDRAERNDKLLGMDFDHKQWKKLVAKIAKDEGYVR